MCMPGGEPPTLHVCPLCGGTNKERIINITAGTRNTLDGKVLPTVFGLTSNSRVLMLIGDEWRAIV
jgi:hypothetical protein